MKYPTLIRSAAALAASLATIGSAQAADISLLKNLDQTQFRLLSEDLGAAVSYKPLVPAESLGVLGFDIGVGVTGTTLKSLQVFKDVTGSDSVPATLPLASVRVHKGLPFDIDIGAALGRVPATNISTYGGEVRWAILPGGTLLPAVALRGAISNLSGVDQMSLKTRSVDLSISKGFLMVTPYAGIGHVWIRSEADIKSGPAVEKFQKTKLFAGVNINLGINLALEADKVGDVNSYGVKLGVRF